MNKDESKEDLGASSKSDGQMVSAEKIIGDCNDWFLQVLRLKNTNIYFVYFLLWTTLYGEKVQNGNVVKYL